MASRLQVENQSKFSFKISRSRVEKNRNKSLASLLFLICLPWFVFSETTETPGIPNLFHVADVPAALEAKAALREGVRLESKPYLPAQSFSTPREGRNGHPLSALTQAFMASDSIDEAEADHLRYQAVGLCLNLIQAGKLKEAQVVQKIRETRRANRGTPITAEDSAREEGHQEFMDRVNRGDEKVLVTDERGKAELNVLDRKKFPRVVVEGSNTAVIFVNEDLIHPDSRHLRRLIASQRVDGGRSRTDGLRGRSVIVAWYKNGNERGFSHVTRTDYYPRHEAPAKLKGLLGEGAANLFSSSWWRDFILYLDNPFKKDQWMDHVLFMGLTFGGLLQMNVTAWVRNLEILYHPSAFSGSEKVWFTGIFGTIIGIFSTQVRRAVAFPLTDTGKALVHAFLTSIPFAVIYKLMDPEQGAKVFDMTHAVGWKTLADLMSIWIITNAARVNPYKMVALMNRERKNVHKFMGTTVADWQNQFASILILMPPRLLDLGISWGFAISVAGAITIPLSTGKLILLGLWPAGQYAYTRLAESMKVDDAPKIRQAWEKSLFGVSLSLPIGTFVDLAKAGVSWISALEAEHFDVVRSDFTDSKAELAKAKSRLEKIVSRWELQKKAPPFHAGRLLSGTGRAIQRTASLVESLGHKVRLLRRQDDEGPIVPKLTALASQCASHLERLAAKLQRPFLDELNAQHPLPNEEAQK